MAAGNTHTITPPLRREWPLTSQGLSAPQTNRPPYCSVMRTASATRCYGYWRVILDGHLRALGGPAGGWSVPAVTPQAQDLNTGREACEENMLFLGGAAAV